MNSTHVCYLCRGTGVTVVVDVEAYYDRDEWRTKARTVHLPCSACQATEHSRIPISALFADVEPATPKRKRRFIDL